MSKITVARGMSELKLLDSRINKAIRSGRFVDVWQNKQDMALKTNVSKADFEKAAKASTQSINGLIERRNTIKSAILISNALTKVKISGKEYAVIEAIERKNSIKYEQSYLETMRAELVECKQNMESNRVQVDKNVQGMVEASLGRDAKPSEEDYKAISEPYVKTHELKLLDPCKVEEKIKELDEKIDEFLKEVDICLTESNSRTKIEVPD